MLDELPPFNKSINTRIVEFFSKSPSPASQWELSMDFTEN